MSDFKVETNPFDQMATKLETAEKLMHLMNNHRINKVKLDGIELEVTHFPPKAPSPEEIAAMTELAKAQIEVSKQDAMDTLLYSARPM